MRVCMYMCMYVSLCVCAYATIYGKHYITMIAYTIYKH